MTTEETQKVLDELNEIKVEELSGNSKRLFEAIMKIADERDKLKKHNYDLLRKLKNRVKEVKKLEKYSIYKKEFSTLNKKIKEKDKIIDLMAEKLAEYEFEEMCAEAEIYHIGCPREDDLDGYMKCIKRYFENKAKEYLKVR